MSWRTVGRGTKRSKYGNRRTTVEGITFDSKRESERYKELRLLEKAGEIRELSVQHRYPLHAPARGSVKSEEIGCYVSDFRYRAGKNGLLVVEDVKSVATKTALYRWKKRHMRIQYGIEIHEV